jgi:pyruvate,orthophosphate dikinase
MSHKWIYYFGETAASDKNLVGGKGANLSEMVRMGLPIPMGFTATCEACIAFQGEHKWPAGMEEQLASNLARLQRDTKKNLGDGSNPLLLSVRSGAAVSMPGMMDTVLNLGLNDQVVEAWIKSCGNERFCLDSYRRFIQMYSDVVVGIHKGVFREGLDNIKAKYGVVQDNELTPAHLRELIGQYKALYKKETGEDFPTDPLTQLSRSITAVFASWNNPRAITYRDLNKMSHTGGTAVNVQAMVFGNLNNDSGTGVAFTRNPSTGANVKYGEYLMNAQGEDVVAGVRTPNTLATMKSQLPDIHQQLFTIFTTLENHFRDMQDIEFTIENQELFILQTRNGKRTAPAAVKIAVDMFNSGLITAEQAVMRVTPTQLELVLTAKLDTAAEAKALKLCTGLPASPGAAVGQIVFTAERAVEEAAKGKSVILIRLETSPDDIAGMHASKGVLTARGGMTSHAAVVARGMNLCCVAGVSSLEIDEENGRVTFRTADGQTVTKGEGDWLSLNGTSGCCYDGQLSVVEPKLGGEFGQFLAIADTVKTMDVYANADDPESCRVALEKGAQGVGLVRTEHMFFDKTRLPVVQEMIVAPTTEAREAALAKLFPFQCEDFEGILKVMSGKPVVIRLLDPPLHEFLPHLDAPEDIKLLASRIGVASSVIEQKVSSMHEQNPMLGFRGCRLGIVYPEISAMQVKAIFTASLVLLGQGFSPNPLIEVPLAGNVKEFIPLKEMILRIAKETGAEGKVNYEIGTMIEVPRAALTADEFAEHAHFMSFGTNDLTQMTCGLSRDDTGALLKAYTQKGIYPADPFVSLDGTGVAKLMQITAELARSVKPNIDLGICGEHGGDPDSIEICQLVGLNNISCSPYRVPVARLAAARAAVKHAGRTSLPINITAKL